jgi:hypothetical protein
MMHRELTGTDNFTNEIETGEIIFARMTHRLSRAGKFFRKKFLRRSVAQFSFSPHGKKDSEGGYPSVGKNKGLCLRRWHFG